MAISGKALQQRNYGKLPEILPLPDLIELQMRSFRWFQTVGLREVFAEISPIEDFTGKNFELSFEVPDTPFDRPPYDENECRKRDLTYQSPLRVRAKLLIKQTGEIKEMTVFMGDFPLMSSSGTFIYNGTERVVVSQLVRSPGVYYTRREDPSGSRYLYSAKLIPNRGAWLEFETSAKDILTVKVDKRRTIPVTALLRAVGYGTDSEIHDLFREIDDNSDHPYIATTIGGQDGAQRRDPSDSHETGLREVYKRIRPGDPVTLDNAKNLIDSTFFNSRRYDLGRVGRYKLNKRLQMPTPPEVRTLTPEDLVYIVRRLIELNNSQNPPDDIDHLGNRRVRAVGELLQNQFRIGLLRMERVIKERMTLQDPATVTPAALINTRPVVAAVREFFGGSQLSQFMDQTNPLSELGHKRRLSAMGPGGLSRDRAGFDVRDVHYSHYGRICPIETPEGPNIGLIGSLASYGRVNEYGFIETPYRQVFKSLEFERDGKKLIGHTTMENSSIRMAEQAVEFVTGELRKREKVLQPLLEEVSATEKLVEEAQQALSQRNQDYESLSEKPAKAKKLVQEAQELLEQRKTQLQSRKKEAEGPANRVKLAEQELGLSKRALDQAKSNPTEPYMGIPSGTVITQKELAVFERELAEVKKEKGDLAGNPENFDIPLRPFASMDADGVTYLSADEEDMYIVSQANARVNEVGEFLEDRVACRAGGQFLQEIPDRIDIMDVSPKQIVSVPTSLIPFLEHDDANRALMGANMQRQAVPLLKPEAPLVATGMEWKAAEDSGQVLCAEVDGIVSSATAREIRLLGDDGEEHVHSLKKFERTNAATCFNQRAIVRKGERVAAGQPLADSSSTDNGQLALGQNVLCAFMFWEGGNYEDAIIISDRVVQDDLFTSVHVEKYECEARDTKLGPEEITRDIPNVAEEALRNLDENGVIYVGAEVHPDDILVGKVTPKGETDLTGEDRLLRAIFGKDARDVKDTSKRMPAGEHGKVVDVHKFEKEMGDELSSGVNEMVRVSVASKRKLMAGDKMAGRHGNKGVVARIMPVEDMPHLADGTPVDIVLSPLGAPSRMNLGQILEAHLGWAAHELGYQAVVPVFDSAVEGEIESELESAELPSSGKAVLYDGRSGEAFDQEITVGWVYMLKLAHLVENKVHARSTGPYSLITQQPLGGKAQFGGQRFGEMEVWALEAYGAAYTLQEMLTVKSDDVHGRVKTYEAIVKGEEVLQPGIPESFKVLVKELQSLALAVEVLNENEEEIRFPEEGETEGLPDLGGINLQGREHHE